MRHTSQKRVMSICQPLSTIDWSGPYDIPDAESFMKYCPLNKAGGFMQEGTVNGILSQLDWCKVCPYQPLECEGILTRLCVKKIGFD